MPRDSHLFKECNEKIEELVLSLTLPLYFALSGLKTDVTQINTADQGAMVVLVCVIATVGKVRGEKYITSYPIVPFSLSYPVPSLSSPSPCNAILCISTLVQDQRHISEECLYETAAS